MEVIPTKPKEEEEMKNEGVIYRISGPVVTATGMAVSYTHLTLPTNREV